jgi:hypothetical protein
MNKPNKSATILADAIQKTDRVQDELEEAAGVLNVTNAVLSQSMSTAQAVAEMARAAKQNVAAEAKVQGAAEELENVKEMLQDAQAAQGEVTKPGNKGEGTASILAYFEGRRAQVRDDENQQAKRDAE